MPAVKNIVFISHDNTRTGAPILLLNLAEALLQHGGYNLSFLIKHQRGDIYKRFSDLAPVTVAAKEPRQVKGSLPAAIARRLLKPTPFSEKHIAKALEGADIVLSNTITNGDLLPYVRRFFKGPVISYIHELKMAAAYFTTPENIRNLLDCTDRFLVCSEAVKTFLQASLHVDPRKVDMLHYYIPKTVNSPAHEPAATKEKHVRSSFVVGGAGTADWRKGPEFFIAVAAIVYAKQPGAAISFVWKGVLENSPDLPRLQYDINKAGLTGKINFIPASSGMKDFYEQISVFLLTSREDPYPLVVLEAAGHGIPSVCFREAGGAVEFVEEDAGMAVKYLDVRAMAEAILFYYKNPAALTAAGNAARQKLIQRHQQPSAILSELEAAISKLTLHAKS